MTDYKQLCAELLAAWEIELGELAATNRLAKRARAALAEPELPAFGTESLAVRPLLEKVARMGDCIGQQTVGEIMAISDRAAAWLRDNPPGQPIAIEPRGCPTPGACSCVEPALVPVPVSERLPGPEDCDAQKRCWHFAPAEGFGAAGWSFYQSSEDDTHWLPAHALPLPNNTSRSNFDD